ncbi:hypothetical protein N658DRAFT_552544 [Parathielavia hyrcaniae]|uniref:Heterokaryon incompatibility domain-containing protein n=1 Tax=Parathielavia hyrcaniae TaxID=113614 RepID=A0AAN6Q2U1_9PEZI|nr:hypothetical protein N658DRAFT_552544 [Parathielavia hyrcaniae]
MLSHLRFHRRAPSNSASPVAEQAPAWDAAAQSDHPLPPRDDSPRPDARPRSPSFSHLPPKLPPVSRLASTGSDELFAPHDDAPPASQEARHEEYKPGFIGGVALQKYRRATQEQVPAVMNVVANPNPDPQLSRAKPPPPPINTGLAARPAVQGNKQTKSSWFSTPTDIQGSGVPGKKPVGPRQGNETAPASSSEPPKGKKGLPFLKNPVSSLLHRRKVAHASADAQPPAPSYDPRIRGTRVHDFSAPRPRKAVSNAGSASTRNQEGTSAVAGLGDQGEPTASHLVKDGAVSSYTEHTEDAKDEASVHSPDDANHTQRRPPASITSTLSTGQPALVPSHDGHSLHASSSVASRDTQATPLPPTSSPSMRTTASRQLSVSATSVRDSVASAIPRHMKSTSSRFSFDMIGAAEEEKLLEERHRKREQEKKTSDDPADGDARFDDFDEDFDYDAMMHDDGLEEPIPGVNADYDYDYNYEDQDDQDDQDVTLDPDNDQENFAGFVFQRSEPDSSLVSPHTPGIVPTPRDATGKRVGTVGCGSVNGPYVHHRRPTPEAAQIAAASGKFLRSSSPEVLAGLTNPPPDPTDTQDRDTNNAYLGDYDNDGFAEDLDDFDFDDEAIIAEANASALANDCDGFYGQEFGFYSAPIPHHHPHPVQSSSSSTPSPPSAGSGGGGGILTSENLFQYANGGYFGPASAASLLNRSMSGRAAVREPNLTPITERSEYSNRNSVMSFTLPPVIGGGGGGGSDTGGRNSSLSMAAVASASPGLAQLALLPHDSDEWEGMNLAGLMKLRSKAWGGSQGSLVASSEGSPRSERAVPVVGMDGGAGSPFGAVAMPAHLAGHVRVGSGLSLWGFSEEVGEDGGSGCDGRESGPASPVAGLQASGGLGMSTVLPPRPGSAGAVLSGAGGAAGVGGNGMVASPLPQRPQSLFLPPQAPLPVPSPGMGGSVCSPVLEGEEHEAEAPDGFRLAPALPVTPSGSVQLSHAPPPSKPRTDPRFYRRRSAAPSASSSSPRSDRWDTDPTMHNDAAQASLGNMWSSSLPLQFPSSRRQCRGCDHPRPKYNGGYASVRTNLSAMLSNARYAGCDVCRILSDGVLKFLSDESCGLARDDVDELRIDFNLTVTKRSLEVVLLGTPIKLFFYASEPTPWLTDNLPDLPIGKTVPSSTASDESLDWAVQQLETCKQFHVACNSFPPAPLPSRVLDVSARGESGVRLHVSQGEVAPYTALSHCWGRKPFLRTLSGSLDAHQSEIAWARLPPTFQEAVAFTRKLGIRYLWIDSLCIVQDDQHDWRREAARMASVYQNAALVISAAKSEGAYGGLHAEFPTKNKTHTVESYPGQHDAHPSSPSEPSDPRHAQPEGPTEQRPEQIHLRLALSHAHRLLSPYHAPTSSSLPVFSRGWILQERFLSPRILHFGPEELSFECLEMSTCQCTPSFSPLPPVQPQAMSSATPPPPPPSWYQYMLDRTARPKHYYALTTWLEFEEEEKQVDDEEAQDGGKSKSQRRKRKISSRDLATVWRRLVEDYTHLSLTHDRDIFPAISGMARLMQQAMIVGDDGLNSESSASSSRSSRRSPYVAGLWRDGLLAGDLLWRVELPPRSAISGDGDDDDDGGGGGGDTRGTWAGGWECRPARWRAPSWSWASVRAPVGFVGGEEGVEPPAGCELVEVVCEPDGEDGMGELWEGGSWLVLKGRLIPAVLRLRDCGREDKGKELQPWNLADLDVLDGGHLKNLWVDDNCKWLIGDRGRASVYCLVVGRKLPGKEVLCLLLARVPWEEHGVLAHNRELSEDGYLYTRIGLVEILGGPPSPVPWGWLHNLLDLGEDSVVRIV